MKPGGAPRNRKVSIHNMYKRRLRKLSRVLDQYLHVAQAKLDPSQSGNVHNRAEIEHLAEKGAELARLLPAQEGSADPPQGGVVAPDPARQRASGEVRFGPDASEFFEGLTEEELEEMKRAFNKEA